MQADLELRNGSILRLPVLDLSLGGLGFARDVWPATVSQIAGAVKSVRLIDGNATSRSGAIPVSSVDAVASRFGLQFAFSCDQQRAWVVGFLYRHSTQVSALLAARRRRLGFLSAYAYFLRKTLAGLWYWGRFLYEKGHYSYLAWRLVQPHHLPMVKRLTRARRWVP